MPKHAGDTDTFSGAALSFPERSRSTEVILRNFKFFTGPKYSSPHIVVKSDAAGEIIGAVERLGWHSTPSLGNTWPHNTVHERHQGKLKSVQRASMLLLQSGIPESGWDVAGTYASIILTVVEPAPILSYERNAAGQVLEAFIQKSEQTCWECFHRGIEFGGPIQPFGRLCWYRGTSGHPLTAPALPGFFAGWRLEGGMRYRGIVLILDYES